MNKDIINYAVIGAGNIAVEFCEAIELVAGENERIKPKVVAVASKSIDRAKTFAQKCSIPDYYDSYEEMLKRNDIDAVYIATTHNFHYENIMLCIKYKKHVICEKCMVLTKAHAVEIFEKAKQANVFVMEAMWSRFLPYAQKVREWIKSDKIGTLEVANFSIGFHANEDPTNRYFNPDLAGGTLYDIGVYAIEMATYLIGEEVKEVKTMTSYAKTGVDKVNNISLRFENCIANLQCTLTANMRQDNYIYGTKGYIKIASVTSGGECYLYDETNKEVEKFTEFDVNGFIYEIKHMINCLTLGKLESDIIPHKDTISCVEIFEQSLLESLSF